MSDSDTPEISAFKPDPKKGIFDRPPIEPRAFTEPDPNYNPSSPDTAPPTDQESLFKDAAIRCSLLQDKLSSLIKTSPNMHPSMETFVYRFSNSNQIVSYDSSMLGVEGGQNNGSASIKFTDGIADHAEKIGIKATSALKVGAYTDEKTREQFREFAKKDPIHASNFKTQYFFTPEGDYGKISIVSPNSEIRIPNQQPLYSVPMEIGYRSEMTQEDFEIAGRALQELIEKLEPQE